MAAIIEARQLGNGSDNLIATWEASENSTTSMKKDNSLLFYRDKKVDLCSI